MSFRGYPDYKSSGFDWMGEIPFAWFILPLKRAFEIIGGSTPSADEINWGGPIQWATPADLSKLSSPYIQSTRRTLSHLGRASCGCSLLPTRSIILSTRAPIGSLAINTEPMSTNQGCKGLVPYRDISSVFFAYVLSISTELLNNLGKGTTFLEISGDELGRFPAAFPTFPEQTQIARFLDHETAKIDTLIHEQKRLIELLKEKRQAVISHAVTKGLDPDVPMKDSGVEWLGEVPAHWSVEPLKYLCSFSGGGTPAKENLEYWNGDIPWVSPKDMKSFRISGSKDKITGLALNESSTSLVKAGALLMVVRSGILQRTIPIGINSVDVTLNQDMKALRFKNPDFAEYFAYFIKGYEPSLLIEWRKQGATVESIEQEYLGESLTLVPPLNEVAKIIEHLSHVDQRYGSLQAEAKKSSAMLLERRSALISAAVTGKIDVRNWQPPADERVFDEEMRQAEMKVIA